MLPIGGPSRSYFNYLGIEIIPPKSQMFTKGSHCLGEGSTCPLSLFFFCYDLILGNDPNVLKKMSGPTEVKGLMYSIV